MLLENRCVSLSSIGITLIFDDGYVKEAVISKNDLIDVDYNANGVVKHIIGRVATISTVGTDPKGWYIVVDGSDDFISERAKFGPKNIIDVNILAKDEALNKIGTPIGTDGVPYLRLKEGRLQWSNNFQDWYNVKIGSRDIITEAPSDYPEDDYYAGAPIDGIEDANY